RARLCKIKSHSTFVLQSSLSRRFDCSQSSMTYRLTSFGNPLFEFVVTSHPPSVLAAIPATTDAPLLRAPSAGRHGAGGIHLTCANARGHAQTWTALLCRSVMHYLCAADI